MAAGDLTASAPVTTNASGLKTTIDALNLAAVTDFIMVVPMSGRDQQFTVFKVERAAA